MQLYERTIAGDVLTPYLEGECPGVVSVQWPGGIQRVSVVTPYRQVRPGSYS